MQVWHNYSFDRHVMERLGVGMAGFDGDTMHMARLWDSSRGSGRGGYSLEALSSEQRLADGGLPRACTAAQRCMRSVLMCKPVVTILRLQSPAFSVLRRLASSRRLCRALLPLPSWRPHEYNPCPTQPLPAGDRSLMDDGSGGEQDIRGKVSMKTLFGRRNLKKDGTEGKVGRALGHAACAVNRGMPPQQTASAVKRSMHDSAAVGVKHGLHGPSSS